MSPINVIDPAQPASRLYWRGPQGQLQRGWRSGDLCQVRRERALRWLGKPDDKLRAHARSGPVSLSAVLRSRAGPERVSCNLNLQLVPVSRGKAHERRAVCALVADGTEDVHGRIRYNPGNQHQLVRAIRETMASSRHSICSRARGVSYLTTFRLQPRSQLCTICRLARKPTLG